MAREGISFPPSAGTTRAWFTHQLLLTTPLGIATPEWPLVGQRGARARVQDAQAPLMGILALPKTQNRNRSFCFGLLPRYQVRPELSDRLKVPGLSAPVRAVSGASK